MSNVCLKTPCLADVNPLDIQLPKTYRPAVEHHMIRHPAAVEHLAQQHLEVPFIP